MRATCTGAAFVDQTQQQTSTDKMWNEQKYPRMVDDGRQRYK